ncbi:hypothetical protein V6L77_09865 [Pannonibacter sp. Pt2-lr]
MRKLLCALALSLTASLVPFLAIQPAQAASCGNDASGFNAWLAAFKEEAPGKYGLKSYTVANALEGSPMIRRSSNSTGARSRSS